MSRQEFNLTVNTGGEEGQILDHLLCARDPNVRHRDAKDLLKLVGNLRSRIAELDAERDRLREEKRKVRSALVALVGEDDPEILRKMLCAVSVMAARGIGTKDAGANSAAIEALIEVKP